MIRPHFKSYLNKRSDTIRIIIERLCNKNYIEELQNSGFIRLDREDIAVEDFSSDWEPKSSKAANCNLSIIVDDIFSSSKSGDLIALLINLYDCRDSFIEEYISCLADKLLNDQYLNLTQEGFTIQQLMISFGSENLWKSEILLRDMLGSKNMRQRLVLPEFFDFRVLSHVYWPEFEILDHKLPCEVDEVHRKFEKIFSETDSDKYLRWRNTSKVEIEVEIAGEVRDFETDSLSASILCLISQKRELTYEKMSTELNCDIVTVRDRTADLISKGILMESEEKVYARNNFGDHFITIPKHKEQTLVSDMECFWPFIFGMLTNLGELPLSRIHSMLNMFVQAPLKFDRSENELLEFLHLKVDEGKLLFSLDLYSLPSN